MEINYNKNIIPEDLDSSIGHSNDGYIDTSLSDIDIENIVKAAENAIPDGGIDMRVVGNSVEVNPETELVIGEAITNDKGYIIGDVNTLEDDGMDEIDRIAASFENQTANVSLFDIEDGETSVVDEEAIINKTADTAKETFDLSDEEVFQMVNVLNNMRSNPKYPVYANLPEKIQLVIGKLAYDNKVPVSKLEAVSRAMLEELISEAGIDSTLIDLEKALNEALNIPSIMDMYTEHTRSVMEDILPKTIENIKDEFPDKAEKLEGIKKAFTASYDFSYAKETYVTNARLRKAIRRFETEFQRSIDMFNYMNEKSNFKMNDANHLFGVLKKVLITDLYITYSVHEQTGDEMSEMDLKLYKMHIEDGDIKKFCILICKSCENYDPNNVIHAAYMYYLVRNIIALRHTNEAKTDFAVELINNICDTITFIRDKESEFNESNMDKSKSTKKHGNKKCSNN